jgi:hypothetical protein
MNAIRSSLAGLVACCICADACAATAYSLNTAGFLVQFDTATPGSPTGLTTIAGLGLGETVLGFDFRPSTLQLVAITEDAGGTGRIYTVNPGSGVATFLATMAADPADQTNAYASLGFGVHYSVDFDPQADRLRIAGDSDQNLSVDVASGLTITDATLHYGALDANAATNPTIVGIAYSNNHVGATSTALHGIDSGIDILAAQNPPSDGTLNTFGSLGVDTSSAIGFDIVGGANDAYAALTVAGTAKFFKINLATGAATFVANFPGSQTIVDMAVFPDLIFANSFE